MHHCEGCASAQGRARASAIPAAGLCHVAIWSIHQPAREITSAPVQNVTPDAAFKCRVRLEAAPIRELSSAATKNKGLQLTTTSSSRLTRARDSPAFRDDFPTADIDRMLTEIEIGYAADHEK